MAKRSLDLIEKTLNKAEVESTEIIKIDINDLVPSVHNDYEMNRIAETAEDIKNRGLRHNLVVWKGERNAETGEIEQTGKYTIESGHRRLECIKYGNANGLFDIRKVDCKVVPAPKNELFEQLYLIQDNREVREEKPESIINDYLKLKDILQKLKESGELVTTGKLRDEIANRLGISSGQVARIENVVHNATEEVKAKAVSGEYSLNTASEVAGLTEEEQREIAKEDNATAFKKAKEIKKTKKEPKEEKTVEVEKIEETEEINTTKIDEVEKNVAEEIKSWKKEDFTSCLEYALLQADLTNDQKETILNIMNGLLMKEPQKALEFIKM